MEHDQITKEIRELEKDVHVIARRIKKFGLLEILQVAAGAVLLTALFAIHPQLWVIGISYGWDYVVSLNLIVLGAALIVLYFDGYLRIKRHHALIARSVTLRLAALYLTCFFIAAIFLTIVRGSEWLLVPELALKQIFALALPALAGGVISDFIFAER